MKADFMNKYGFRLVKTLLLPKQQEIRMLCLM
jgi:hypothetical protein